MNSKPSLALPKMVGQTAATGFQIGVRRTLPISREGAWTFLTSQEGLKLWLGELPPPAFQVGEAFACAEGISGEFKVVKPFQQLRLRWNKPEWEKPSTLQIRLLAAKNGKTTISFHQENLPDAAAREQMKQQWEEALEKLKEKACLSAEENEGSSVQ